MRLKVRNSDPRMIEDEFGNDMFQFVGLHLADVQALVNRVNSYDSLEREVEELQNQVDSTEDYDDLQEEIHDLQSTISDLQDDLTGLKESIKELVS